MCRLCTLHPEQHPTLGVQAAGSAQQRGCCTCWEGGSAPNTPCILNPQSQPLHITCWNLGSVPNRPSTLDSQPQPQHPVTPGPQPAEPGGRACRSWDACRGWGEYLAMAAPSTAACFLEWGPVRGPHPGGGPAA